MDTQEPSSMGPAGDAGGPPMAVDHAREGGDADFRRDSGGGHASHGDSNGKELSYREKQAKPNKVYVGGLPEHTRPEDLQSCFGKIGHIVNIELKVGYGFVEFDRREAADESVAKYNEGYFMGNKIKVEISKGGSRVARASGDPGACFKCGNVGHWARECPNHNVSGGYRGRGDPMLDRPPRDFPGPPPPPRDFPPYRDDLGPPGRLPPPRDPRYEFAPPPPRDFRRPPTPPRGYRDYLPGPPPPRSSRDYDDYRLRGPPVPPPPRYYPDERGPPPPPGYPPRYPPPDPFDRYDRRPPPPIDYAYPPSARPRTPPGPPRGRDYEKPRDYPAAPPVEMRRPPVSPPPSRYADYPARNGSTGGASPRYRRRSQSPPPRSAGAAPYESGSYSGAAREGFAGNGYSGGSASAGPPPRGSGSRDYPPRNGRDARDPVEAGSGYRRP